MGAVNRLIDRIERDRAYTPPDLLWIMADLNIIIPIATFYRHIHDGRIKAFKPGNGRRYLITGDDFLSWFFAGSEEQNNYHRSQ